MSKLKRREVRRERHEGEVGGQYNFETKNCILCFKQDSGLEYLVLFQCKRVFSISVASTVRSGAGGLTRSSLSFSSMEWTLLWGSAPLEAARWNAERRGGGQPSSPAPLRPRKGKTVTWGETLGYNTVAQRFCLCCLHIAKKVHGYPECISPKSTGKEKVPGPRDPPTETESTGSNGVTRRDGSPG